MCPDGKTVSEGSPISPVFSDEASFRLFFLGEGYSARAIGRFIEAGPCPTYSATVADGPDGPTVRFRSDIEVLGG